MGRSECGGQPDAGLGIRINRRGKQKPGVMMLPAGRQQRPADPGRYP